MSAKPYSKNMEWKYDMASNQHEIWCVFDSNWPEPTALVTTFANTEQEAIAKACLTDERGASLYSGAALSCVPPKPGTWENLTKHGYRVYEVSVNLTFWSHVADLIDGNHHTEALKNIAERYGLSHVTAGLDGIAARSRETGYLTPAIQQDRDMLRAIIREHIERVDPAVFKERMHLI